MRRRDRGGGGGVGGCGWVRGGEGWGETKTRRVSSSFVRVGIDRGRLIITGEQGLISTLRRMRLGVERGIEQAKRAPPHPP